MRKFRYSGDIRHIDAFIKKNSKGLRPCIVEIYVRSATSEERDAFNIGIQPERKPYARIPQRKGNRAPSKPRNGNVNSRKKVEAISRQVFRAYMEERKNAV